MDDEKKAYAVTDRAGWYVAGRKVPSRRDEDGNVVPLVGHVFWFTEAEARHELRNLTIEEVDPTTGLPVAPLAEPEPAPAPEGEVEDTGGEEVDPTMGQPVAPLAEPESDAVPAPSADGDETGGKRKTKVA